MTAHSEERICPYLGLVNDETVMLSGASELHRCYASRLPRTLDESYQRSWCLSTNHVQCLSYDVGGSESVVELAPQPAPRPARLLTILFVAVLALALVVVASAAFRVVGSIRQANSSPAAIVTDLTGTAPGQGNGEQPAASSSPVAATATPMVNGSDDPTATPTATWILRPTTVPEAGTVLSPKTTGPDGTLFILTPSNTDVGWWRNNDSRRHYVGDSFLYAGQRDGDTYVSAIRFDLQDIPRGARIESAGLELAGLRKDQLVTDAGETWLVQLMPESSLEDLAGADFLTLYSAPASIVLFPQLSANDLDDQGTNTWQFDANTLAWLEQQLLDGAESVYMRIMASPDSAGESLFAWDSGTGSESRGNKPKLALAVGPAPPTPPPLPTRDVIVATLTPLPANVLTVVAQNATATHIAVTIGTSTPDLIAVVTPTPFPINLATVQVNSLALGLPAVVQHTPTPANPAIATADALYATAVAQTTGTFTPVPTGFVTPMIVLPSPPAENVATEADASRGGDSHCPEQCADIDAVATQRGFG